MSGSENKRLSIEELLRVRETARREGRSVVQCHGCFDLIHPGHVRHLKQAAKEGDVLLVSITADPMVKKGDGRPLFNETLRAENLAALGFVDWVTVNPDATAEALLERVRPDVYVKGREYESNDDPRFAAERAAVERNGGRVVFTSGDIVFSSTALIGAMTGEASDRVEADPRFEALRRLREVHDLSRGALEPVIRRMARRRALFVGETIIDTYVACDRPEVAAEAACLSLRPLERASFDGGAAVLARHAAALGASPTLVTALPNTVQAEAFRERMESEGVRVRSVACEAPMLEKQRFLVGDAKVMKLDCVAPVTLDSARRRELLSICAEESAGGVDAAVVTDFGHGMLTRRTCEELTVLLRPAAGVLAGDVSGRRTSLTAMREADVLAPTEIELRDATGDHDSSLNAVVWKLMEMTGARRVATTLADGGMVIFERTGEAESAEWSSRVSGEHIPSLETYPIDALGCGDAMLAAMTLAMAAGAGAIEAGFIGAAASAVASRMAGNEAVGAPALLERLGMIDDGRLAVRTRPVRVAPAPGIA